MAIAISLEQLLTLPTISTAHGKDTLTKALRVALWNVPGKTFRCFGIIHKLDRSVRIFGQASFDGSADFPQPLSPAELAEHLVFFRDNGTRYPKKPPNIISSRAWTILRLDKECQTDSEGNPLIIAYASWLP